MRKRYIFLILIGVTAVGALALGLMLANDSIKIDTYRTVSRSPAIKPDYTGTVIPPNIASLNFVVLEPGTEYFVKIHSTEGESIEVHDRTSRIKIPLRRWRELLNSNRGNELFFDVYVRGDDGLWNRYEKITNTIAREEIDPYLLYRFMKPIFNWWKDMSINQRNLENYDKSVVLHGKTFQNGCLNCHTFLNNTPEYMTIGIRSAYYKSSSLFARKGKVDKIGTKWGYTAWHPSGRLAAYSINKVRQFFHKTTPEIRDVVDLDSAICCYNVSTRKVKIIPEISEKDRLETYPTWSPDGRYLYYCSAPILWADRDTIPPEHYNEVQYDLMRIPYDAQTDEWGKPETILSADKTGLSILLPRISPDGKYLIFCMCEYGCFPIHQPSSDLYIMDLETGQFRKLTINSEFSESWHSFSSNSRWLAFSSKRGTGLFTRTYFSYIDQNGKVHKSFILPQKDPTYYDSLLQTYSVPELIKSPVTVGQVALARAVRRKDAIEVDFPITGATIKVGSIESWRQER